MKYSNISMSLPSSFLLVSFLVLFYRSTINVHSRALCIDKEKQALLDFKLSFVDDPLDSLSTWSIENDDCCGWEGVQCDADTGNVVSLSLFEAGLKSNKLRPSLLELQHLTSLDLSENHFTMRIPKFIGSLGNLTYLDLSESGFFGEIPPHLGNLSKLEFLFLSQSNSVSPVQSNGLYSNSLQWLSRLSSIEHLDFEYVNLSNAVDWASALKKLPTLFGFECRSCSLPPPLLSSTSHVNSSTTLEVLRLGGNNLNSLSFEGMMFPSSTVLDASSNKISQNLPEILPYLSTNLMALDLSSNMLNGFILDAHFSKFSFLEELILSDNNFLTFGISKSWVPPFQLEILNLSSCKVGPNFPNWVLTQKHLKFVDISNSMISGAIPDAFSEFSFASRLVDLSYNAINGPIPLPLFGASVLFLSNNKFSSFPSFHDGVLWDRGIMIIDLSKNDLSGTLPNWLFQFPNLHILNLANNKLSGNLPEAIGSLRLLHALHLRNNMFSGELPLSMENCTRLAVLELANNKFSGVVPSWLGESMAHLSILTLRSNNFGGDLPASLCNLQGLQIIDLSENRLSGTLPGCLHNFSSMAINKGSRLLYNYFFHVKHFLYESFIYPIKYNDSESVMWKGALVELNSRNLVERNVINLSGNLLRGEIPIGLTALKELRSLDLSSNDLNGSIPDKMGQLTSLEVLKLSSNRLFGEIPESLGALTFLGTLNLSNNNLSGRIPTGTQLQGFDPSSFAGNPKLCGQPLPTKCPGDKDDDNKQPLPGKDAHDEDDESFDIQAFLAALGMGFAVGFLGILGSLHFSRPWRVAFFQLVNNIADKVIVATYISLR